MTGVAVVTGGSRGIGRAISAQLKDDGYTVAVVYVGNEAAAEACEAELGIETFKCDIGCSDECQRTVAVILQRIGPIDVLVNNAGVTRDAMFHKMDEASWDTVIRTDLTGLFNMTHPVISGMRERCYGRIVNIASINGQKGQFGQTNYAAAKAGVIGFTKALAVEAAAKGITVNTVAPGYIETDMVATVPEGTLAQIRAQIPVGRLGRAEEVARCVSFLADPAQGFITGATLTINGGQYMA